MPTKPETILKANAPLFIDVTCYSCKRRVAMSNTVERDGRRYCFRCDERLFSIAEFNDKKGGAK